MTAPGATERRGWGELVAAVLEFVQFDVVLGDAALHRTAEAIVRTRLFHAPAGELADAIRRALASQAVLSELAVVDHTEPQVRKFLEQLGSRLESLRPWPAWRYEQVGVAAWDSADVRPVAYLPLSPVWVANQLGIGFERATEAGVAMELAVLRLAGGGLVALARELAAPTTGTAVLVQGAGPDRSAVTELLAQAGPLGEVVWLDGAAPGER